MRRRSAAIQGIHRRIARASTIAPADAEPAEIVGTEIELREARKPTRRRDVSPVERLPVGSVQGSS